MASTYLLYTMQNSPYSDKIRALLHYKKLHVVENIENAETRFSVLQARTGKTMVPVVITPADEAMNDSTAIAANVEAAVPSPPTRWKDPETDTVAMLLEDYADEWLVRIMLASRWYHPADAAQNAAIIACGMTHGVPGLEFQRAAREFPPSIISTLPKMGATRENAEAWYAMLPRILAALERALARSLFLTGAAPHLADFAFYGQLNQIRRDPTGHGWVAEAPALVREWLERIEAVFTGKLDPASAALDDLASLRPLVEEMSSTYLRMQVANALAVEAAAPEVRASLGGGLEFVCAPAKYNAKLLGANLDTLERLYSRDLALPPDIGAPIMRELAPLAAANSPLLETRPTLRAALWKRDD
ncbi:MAG: glutathione S-transferase family protein [Candidatus Binatia bacterium]